MNWRLTHRSAPGSLLISALTALLLFGGCAGRGIDDAERGAGNGSTAHLENTNPDGLYGTLVSDPPLDLPAGTYRTTTGQPFTFADRAPHTLTALFFGFTHCDDVCPTTMADLAQARRSLPATLRTHVNVVFVTVDPRRDTPPVLSAWLHRFDPTFVGLRGSNHVVTQAQRALYAAPSEIAGPSRPPHRQKHGAGRRSKRRDYEVNHTGSVYLFGPHEQTVVYTGGITARQYAADFTALLSDA